MVVKLYSSYGQFWSCYSIILFLCSRNFLYFLCPSIVNNTCKCIELTSFYSLEVSDSFGVLTIKIEYKWHCTSYFYNLGVTAFLILEICQKFNQI